MSKFNAEKLNNYTLIKKERIEELATDGYLLRHNKTKALIVVMENQDDNKVFNIAFRTPPEDNTGAAHILEHSTLCGSKNYPVKNPFEELIQGSLNTFLNAITYGDKTMYPVASCNMSDLKNLMDVYLDAVFYPNIYKEKEIFMQEGWHYEIDSKEGELSYNGVVYNEMKGVYSTPDRVLDKYVSGELWKDTCYGKDSGGVPENIPELTYEKFLDFHRKYYHPSNSYIYLYGDMDMEERLNYLDEEYLSKFDEQIIDSEIKLQKPFECAKRIEGVYSIGEDEEAENKAIISYTTTAGLATDRELYYGFSVLAYALIQMPGAPLKKALVDAGVAKVVSGGFGKNTLQSTFEIIAKDADENRTDDFINIVESTLRDIVKNGIDRKALKGALNVMEFQYREADFGRFPKGLLYLLYVMDSWLYDENEPFMHVAAGKTFEELGKKAEEGYFETLINDYILNNNHKVICTLRPEKGLEKRQNEILSKKLKEYKETLTEDELEKLIEETRKLKEYQNEPSPREDVEKIPLIELSDIDREPKHIKYEVREIDGVKVIYTKAQTNGIAYVGASFDCKYVPEEMLSYAGLLENIYTDMDTENYKYADLNNEINTHSGGLYTSINIYNDAKNYKKCQVRFACSIKVLYKDMDFVQKIMSEVLFRTKYEDKKRLKEIIEENVPAIRNSIISGGDRAALYRCLSHISEIGYMNDLFSGIGTFEFFKKLDSDFDYEKITGNIKKVMDLIFDRKNLVLSLTADDEGLALFEKNIGSFIADIKDGDLGTERAAVDLHMKNEAIVIPSPVSYSVMAGNYKDAGFGYTGTMKCLENILDYGYLWQQVRVLGGAYGVSSSYHVNSGNLAFRSYRDPNVKKTYEVYKAVADYLSSFEADEREIKKYIIGAISSLDAPRTPRAEGVANFGFYITGKSMDEIKKEREEVLTLSIQAIRNTGAVIKKTLENSCVCTVGNKEKLEEVKDMFDEIREIF